MTQYADQIAALPMRWEKDGTLKVLMVTSRETKRWVMPKGWEMDGKKPWRAAEIEALEEAGAVGHIGREALGTYTYLKRLADGSAVPCEVRVFPMIVQKLRKDWKERKERKRHWFTPQSAAEKVHEAELSELLLTLTSKPKKDPVIKALLKKTG